MLSFSSRAEIFAASARGFDVLMRLIVAAAANEITMSCGRLAAGPPRGGHCGGAAPPSRLSRLFRVEAQSRFLHKAFFFFNASAAAVQEIPPRTLNVAADPALNFFFVFCSNHASLILYFGEGSDFYL